MYEAFPKRQNQPIYRLTRHEDRHGRRDARRTVTHNSQCWDHKFPGSICGNPLPMNHYSYVNIVIARQDPKVCIACRKLKLSTGLKINQNKELLAYNLSYLNIFMHSVCLATSIQELNSPLHSIENSN